MEYNCPIIKMSKEIDQIIDLKNEDGTGTITVKTIDGTIATEKYHQDSYESYYSKTSAIERASQRVQNE